MQAEREKIVAEDILVIPVDMDKLNEHINSSVKKVPEGKCYKTLDRIAFVGEKPMYIDADCVITYLEPYLVDGKTTGNLNLPFYEKSLDETKMTLNLVPSFRVNIPTSTIGDFVKEPITLKEFMGTNFNYNARYKSNINNLVRELED